MRADLARAVRVIAFAVCLGAHACRICPRGQGDSVRGLFGRACAPIWPARLNRRLERRGEGESEARAMSDVVYPKQNRVTPFGEIVARPERGLFTGNRGGALHDEAQRIVRHFTSKRWIICALEFNNRKARIMAPGEYTHLFFLDEATALAAGHRPCFECRRPRAKEFYQLWLETLEPEARELANLDRLDAQLHQERIVLQPGRRRGGQKTHDSTARELPDGAMVLVDRLPHLLYDGLAYAWSPSGYGAPMTLQPDLPLTVLTPPTALKVLARGYLPELHPSYRPAPAVKVGVGIMVVRGNEVLLGRRKGSHGAGEYAWPGGHLEYGETIEECIAREISEETGITVRPVRPVSLSNVLKYDRHYIDIQYLVEYVEGTPETREPDKVEGWGWYSLDALPEPLFEFARRGLEGYKAGPGVSYFSVQEAAYKAT